MRGDRDAIHELFDGEPEGCHVLFLCRRAPACPCIVNKLNHAFSVFKPTK